MRCTVHGNQFTQTTDHGPQTTHFKSFLLPEEDLRTLRPKENGTFSTYLHAHMPKMNGSYVTICESSCKVLAEFSELGLKKSLNCYIDMTLYV